MTLTRTEGDCDVRVVGKVLGRLHEACYPALGKALRQVSTNDSKELIYILDDAERFSDFLHLIKNCGGIEITTVSNSRKVA